MAEAAGDPSGLGEAGLLGDDVPDGLGEDP